MEYISLRAPFEAALKHGRSLQAQHPLNPSHITNTYFNRASSSYFKLPEYIHHYKPSIFAEYYKTIETYTTMFLTFVLHTFLATALAQDYTSYIHAPDSRVLHPVGIYQNNGQIVNANSLLGSSNGSAKFSGPSSITFDYGMNIAGIVSVTVGSSSSPDATISLTYTESSLYISNQSCDATAGPQFDQPLVLPVGNGPGIYTVEDWHNRGGFRYLTLTSNAGVEVTSISTNFTAAPSQNLKDYRGYFHSNDEKLNRIWSIHEPVMYHQPELRSFNAALLACNITIANGNTVLTDGAKRDREIWPGDMTVSIPAVFVSTNDMVSIENGINALLDLQHSDGMFPYAGFPFNTFNDVSFTYHLHTLVAIAYYFHYSGDLQYVKNAWDHYTRGVAWSLASIDSSGLMFVTSDKDWLRGGMNGHNIEANAILYYVLNQGINLANLVGDTASASKWGPVASKVKDAANSLLWDADANLYKDNENSDVRPQDGNVWAIKAGITTSSTQNTAISSALKARWGPYGAPAPETGSPATISPFIGSLELEAHFLSSAPQNALDLMRRQWADFMLDDPRMTNSTFIEGYSETGELHYPLYSSDAIISHSHGWSTGPTYALSFYVAGLQLVSESGKTWMIAPQMGDLTEVVAGFTHLRFHTPPGTTGSISLPGVTGTLVSGWKKRGVKVVRAKFGVNGEATGIPGGDWTLLVDG
ncbi:hypothetical protein LOCC1_G005098 [Lachnellula occidentalis]|uniref:Alpha-L-rhamnosidase six-hairpin glycosidase domain-containing protein n=1 Tax=Lachnellula occidentalis TaxID=215460 RepID=A0A8H8RX41_9HELO|nr:hypothetical protein LOCC1_G005098 [Lachnellula occidentalis]